MSKFENDTEKKVRESIRVVLIKHAYMPEAKEMEEDIMLRIRPFLIDLEFIRDIYSITEEDDYLYGDMVWMVWDIKDKIEEYFKKRGDTL